jgi:hypothetical protein
VKSKLRIILAVLSRMTFRAVTILAFVAFALAIWVAFIHWMASRKHAESAEVTTHANGQTDQKIQKRPVPTRHSARRNATSCSAANAKQRELSAEHAESGTLPNSVLPVDNALQLSNEMRFATVMVRLTGVEGTVSVVVQRLPGFGTRPFNRRVDRREQGSDSGWRYFRNPPQTGQ